MTKEAIGTLKPIKQPTYIIILLSRILALFIALEHYWLHK